MLSNSMAFRKSSHLHILRQKYSVNQEILTHAELIVIIHNMYLIGWIRNNVVQMVSKREYIAFCNRDMQLKNIWRTSYTILFHEWYR